MRSTGSWREPAILSLQFDQADRNQVWKTGWLQQPAELPTMTLFTRTSPVDFDRSPKTRNRYFHLFFRQTFDARRTFHCKPASRWNFQTRARESITQFCAARINEDSAFVGPACQQIRSAPFSPQSFPEIFEITLSSRPSFFDPRNLIRENNTDRR